MANTNTAETTTEELEKQRLQQQQAQAEMARQQKMMVMTNIIQSTDPITILKTLSSNQGITLYCGQPYVAYNLLTTLYNDLIGNGEVDEAALKQIATSLNSAIQFSNQRRICGNPMMMGGMGMGMMNPMMMGMGGMNFGMMNPMMGMGMNPMFGMGFGTMGQQQNVDTNNVASIKQFIESSLKPMNMANAVDPLIFLQLLINNGIEIDVSKDPQFSQLCTQAILCAVYMMDQMQLQMVFSTLYYMWYSNYMQKQQEAMSKNNGNNQNQMGGMMNPMMGMGMMNPMMMGMGGMNFGMMNPMMGMGMNPMMMGGMQTTFDQSKNQQNNQMNMNPMMGMGMMNPMMMGGMMNPMMGMGYMGMPGMNNGFGGVQQNSGCIW